MEIEPVLLLAAGLLSGKTKPAPAEPLFVFFASEGTRPGRREAGASMAASCKERAGETRVAILEKLSGNKSHFAHRREKTKQNQANHASSCRPPPGLLGAIRTQHQRTCRRRLCALPQVDQQEQRRRSVSKQFGYRAKKGGRKKTSAVARPRLSLALNLTLTPPRRPLNQTAPRPAASSPSSLPSPRATA